MATSIAPLTPHSTPSDAASVSRPSTPATAGPARGIAMGAALSAPMWIGILYLIRLAL